MILNDAFIIQREICRHRLNTDQKSEADDSLVHQSLMADLLQQQNAHAEHTLNDMMEMVCV